MKLNRVGIGAGLLAATVALAACGSDSGNAAGSSDTAGATGGSSSSSTNIDCATGTLNAAGSSAQANAMDAWTTSFQEKCSGASVNYTASSSGEGVTAFNNGTIGLAGSDAALDSTKGEVAAAAKACGSTALDLPMVVGPIAIAYKLSGVDKLVLNGDVTAKIFLGKIKTWNDPAIKALNSDVSLPSTAIKPFYRSDSSGTTKNFESYLAATAPSVFTSTPDKDSSKAGFAGQGVAKSQGVADGVSGAEGGIGYVEFSYVASGGLSAAQLDNGGGAVELSKDSASKAAGTAKVVGTGDDLSLKIDYAQKTAGAYPLILVTYEIACSKYKDAAQGKLVKSFLTYTSTDGQGQLAAKGYAPIPSDLLTKVKASVAKIS